MPDLIQSGWASSIWAKLTTVGAMFAIKDIGHPRLRVAKAEKSDTLVYGLVSVGRS